MSFPMPCFDPLNYQYTRTLFPERERFWSFFFIGLVCLSLVFLFKFCVSVFAFVFFSATFFLVFLLSFFSYFKFFFHVSIVACLSFSLLHFYCFFTIFFLFSLFDIFSVFYCFHCIVCLCPPCYIFIACFTVFIFYLFDTILCLFFCFCCVSCMCLSFSSLSSLMLTSFPSYDNRYHAFLLLFLSHLLFFRILSSSSITSFRDVFFFLWLIPLFSLSWTR